jgi:hypothetical protein
MRIFVQVWPVLAMAGLMVIVLGSTLRRHARRKQQPKR